MCPCAMQLLASSLEADADSTGVAGDHVAVRRDHDGDLRRRCHRAVSQNSRRAVRCRRAGRAEPRVSVCFEYPKIYDFLEEDLNIFGVIIGTGILVDVVGKSGLFHFLSMWIVRLTGGRASALFLTLCIVTFLFVAVLTIVPAMLILSSLVLVICRSLNYKPVPLLLSVAICANSGAIATFASGLPNIMIGTAAGIPYLQFLKVSLPYAVISLVIAIVALRFFFRNDLPWKQTSEEQAALREQIEIVRPMGDGRGPQGIASQRPDPGIDRRRLCLRSAIGRRHGLHRHGRRNGRVGVSPGKGCRRRDPQSELDRDLFFMGLFIIIGCVKQTGALAWVAEQVIAISRTTGWNC